MEGAITCLRACLNLNLPIHVSNGARVNGEVVLFIKCFLLNPAIKSFRYLGKYFVF